MRQEKLMDALEFVSDELLESAANSMDGKRRVFPWKQVGALAACLALVVGLFWYNVVPPIPRYENAIFSAQQVADLFPVTDKGTNVYTMEGYPNESMMVLPKLPKVDYLNVYKQNGSKPGRAELEKLIEDVFPKIEKMYNTHIPDCDIVQEKDYYTGGSEYVVEADAGGKWIRALSASRNLIVYWGNDDYSPLSINAVTLYAKNVQTDEEIMQSVSAVIPYLEQSFDMELSAHSIKRSFSSYDSDLSSLYVWLYSASQVTDALLEQYGGDPNRYCSGDMICLEFGRADYHDSSDTVVLRRISYVRSLQQRHRTYAQCRMISLEEAEALLANGYVFSNHVCKICMAMQSAVDFSDYDKVSLEYVFDYKDINGYGIPFYTFYKKIKEGEDGFVQYAKTMVPAIEVSGLEEYFKEQEEYHRN